MLGHRQLYRISGDRQIQIHTDKHNKIQLYYNTCLPSANQCACLLACSHCLVVLILSSIIFTQVYKRVNEATASVATESALWDEQHLHLSPQTTAMEACSLITICDLQVVIKNAHMSEEIQQDQVECAAQALEKYKIEKDTAIHIKESDLALHCGAKL